MPDGYEACRVVVCDDATDFVQLLGLLIDNEPGLELVGTAFDGEEAIDRCSELEPDLLVLDVSMPVMDGLTALSHIRERSPNTRVVMLTGYASAEVKRRALELGAVGYLEKGTAPAVLPRHFREYCGCDSHAAG